jgi:hypothetical protein
VRRDLMLKVIIKDSFGNEGAILYDEKTEKLTISHPIKDTRDSVREYLKRPREFTDADGDQVGSRQLIIVEPIKANTFMYKALVEMKHEIDILPVWDDPDNTLPDTHNPYEDGAIPGLGDPNATIVKSVDSAVAYDIINKGKEES